MGKVKSAVLTTAAVVAVLFVVFRIPTVGPMVAKALTPPAA